MCFDRGMDLFFHVRISPLNLLIAEAAELAMQRDIVARLFLFGSKCQPFFGLFGFGLP
jgi:hypothetical protein